MNCRWMVVLLAVAMVLAKRADCGGQPAERVTANDAAEWLLHLVPFPKQVEVLGKWTPRPRSILVERLAPPCLLSDEAVAELRRAFGPCFRDVPGDADAIVLQLQLGGPESAELEARENRDQAYRVLPDGSGRGLRLIALDPRGLFYAAKTLSQLVRARRGDGRVELPVVRISDWPDLAERGLWGSDCCAQLEWLGDCKFNIIEQIAYVAVDSQGRGLARLKEGHAPLVELGPRLAIQPVPAVLHLNQLEGKGLFEAHPEVRAKGGDEGAVCFSQPAMGRVLEDWVVALGRLPHVPEVSVWLTENLHGKGGCTCGDCAAVDRNLLEARVVLNAWRKAKQTIPQVGLRLLLSEETYRSNERILRELPAGVKLMYYHSLFTYTASRQPMIYPLMADWARQGKPLGVYPQLTGAVGRATPFTGAAFVHARMTEFADKGLSCFVGYAIPRLAHARFNVEAAAEWSWNARGRSPSDFARSYAVRHGIKDAEKFAAWSDTLGPVAWRIYGSEWPAGELRPALLTAVEALRQRKLPELGGTQRGVYKKPWGEIETPQILAKCVADASRAVAIARELNVPEFLHESLVIEGYARSLQALWDLKQLIGEQGIAGDRRSLAAKSFAQYVKACSQAASAVREWCRVVAPGVGAPDDSRYWQIVAALERSARDMRSLAKEMNVEWQE